MNKRIYIFDNTKAILIFLVIIGHLIQPYVTQNKTISAIFSFIYSFHMPLFIIVSGYFSKKELNKKILINLFLDYFLLFIISQLLFVFFTQSIGIKKYSYLTLTPAYIYWYIFALFFWNIILKIILIICEKSHIKLEYFIILSFIFGLLIGFINSISWELSLSRIVVFFPFFITGYYFKIKKIEINNLIHNEALAILILISSFIIVYKFNNIFNFNLLSGAKPYSKIKLNNIGYLYRLVLYVMQIAICLSIMKIMPYKKNIISKYGTKTLEIYIIHGFIMKWISTTSFYSNMNLIKIIIIPLIAILIILIIYKLPISFKISKKFNILKKNLD